MNLDDIEHMLNYNKNENSIINQPQENLQEQYINDWNTFTTVKSSFFSFDSL